MISPRLRRFKQFAFAQLTNPKTIRMKLALFARFCISMNELNVTCFMMEVTFIESYFFCVLVPTLKLIEQYIWYHHPQFKICFKGVVHLIIPLRTVEVLIPGEAILRTGTQTDHYLPRYRQNISTPLENGLLRFLSFLIQLQPQMTSSKSGWSMEEDIV